MIHYVLVGDFNRDGWLDLLAVAYTYDDKPETMANSSVIFYGSPSGFSPDRSTVVPTYCGGNAKLADVDRDGWLDIIVYDKRGYLSMYLGGPDGYSQMNGLKPVRLSWKADTPEKTQIRFRLRWAESAEELAGACWQGPAGEESFYEESGEKIRGVERGVRWLQYKATLVSLNGCRSPKLEEVRVDFER